MQSEFWLQRWQQGQIGFHQDVVNPYLIRAWPRLGVKPGATVLVPLCGKSLDMLWLRDQGHQVIGVELSPLAIDAFVAENKLSAQRDRWGKFERVRCAGITLLCGDFFELDGAIGTIDAVYDRASLIALPVDMRKRYAQHLARLTNGGKQVLLVTLEYPQHQMQGPPFAVTEQEVHSLYDATFAVECIETLDTLEQNARFKQQGITRFQERIFVMTRQ